MVRIGKYLFGIGLAGLVGSLGTSFYLDRVLDVPKRGQLAERAYEIQARLDKMESISWWTSETEDNFQGLTTEYIELKKNKEAEKQESAYREAVESRDNKNHKVTLAMIPSLLLSFYGYLRRREEINEESFKSRKAVATGSP